ncbi:MAG: flagellar biosynthesis repressor FlbT, partial [Rhizobiales bacterium]|nr:flagellar biosynthesis repressor FlbT [Hyphomicrobiales bacterium]
HVTAVSNHIMAGEMYKALKSAKALIAYETELLSHVTRNANQRHDRPKGSKSA